MQNNKKIKYFLYARKSSESEDRQMASIDSQIKELNRIVKQNNLGIVRVFSESMSAKSPGRPIFGEMIAKIKQGKANGIICWKLNRLARNPIDGGEISWMLQQGIIQHIQTFGRSYYPADNVIVMAVELGMANQFIRDLSVDTKRGLKTKAERGWYPAFATLGYMNNPFKRKGEKEIIKDPERYDLVRKMFDLILTGNYSPPQIRKIIIEDWALKNKQGKKIARSTVYRILSDTFYYGEFEYPKESGNWYQGKHEPMISREEYDKIQILLGKKNRRRPQKHTFAFTGIIRCGECGAMITAENKIKRQKNGNVHHYTYYHCTKRKKPNCSQKIITKEKLESQIEELLRQIEIPKEFKNWALNILKQENEKESRDRNQILSSQQKAYNSCVKKLDGLIDMRANKEITEEEFLKKKSEILKEKGRLKELIGDSDKRVDNWIDEATKIFTFAELARLKFKNGTLEEKKAILSALGSNLLLRDGKLDILMQKPLLCIKKAVPEVNKIHNRLEPLKNSENEPNFEEAYLKNPILLRR